MKKTIYCLGFAFGEVQVGRRLTTQVALIRKARPDWQAGKLNGIGGHVEEDELPRFAMVREFEEETGCKTEPCVWDEFSKMNLPRAEVYCYRAFGIDLMSLETKTDEEVLRVDVEDLHNVHCIPNISWLLPLAMDREVALSMVRYDG